MFLHTGWEKFTCAHNMGVGCFVNFMWEGDVEIKVKVFDDTSCCRHYQGAGNDDDIGGDKNLAV
jgi:hypothetical protein